MAFELRCADGVFEASDAGMAFLRRAMAAQELLVMTPVPEWTRRTNADEVKQLKAFRAKGTGKVPFVKFESTDGWHLVPEECSAIAKVLDALLMDERKLRTLFDEFGKPWDTPESDLWFIQSFARFCHKASANGGFTVHAAKKEARAGT